MPSDTLSLADYLHAFELVLRRLPRLDPERRTAAACAEAMAVLQRVAGARQRAGLGACGQAEFENLSGHRLPTRVTAWLGECGRRLAAGEFEFLAAHILNLCRAMEWMLVARERLPAHPHLRISDLDGTAAVAPQPTAYPGALGRTHHPAPAGRLVGVPPQTCTGTTIH